MKEERETMDKGVERIAQDIKDIVQTRVAIAEKLGAIEQHIGTTLQHARTTITRLADKTTSSVRDTMEVTKQALDPSVHAARHPWLFVSGALVLGYVVGGIYHRSWKLTDGVVPYSPVLAKNGAVMPMDGAPSSERREPGAYPFYPPRAGSNRSGQPDQSDRPTVWTELERALQDEFDMAKIGFLRFGRGLIRATVRQAIGALVQIVGDSSRERNSRSHSEPSPR